MKDQDNGKRKAKVITPLHLLQTLTSTLNEHLGEACQQAEKDARKALEKLHQQQSKLEQKLAEAEEKVAARRAEGREQKSMEKCLAKVASLREALAELQRSRDVAEVYTRQLQSDVRQTLRIAKGLERIQGQASLAIEKRNQPAQPKTRAPRQNRKPVETQA